MPEAGTFRQDYLPVGAVTVGFEPEEGAAERVAELSSQLESDLARLKQHIADNDFVKQRAREWAHAERWGGKIILLQEARDRGLQHGAHAWGEQQVGFFHEVGHALYAMGAGAVHEAENAWDWYTDQSLIDQVFPLQAAERQLAAQVGHEIEHLWQERQQLLALFKKLSEQGVNDIEVVIEALANAPGQIGRIMATLKDKGYAWVQGLIELCRQTDALNQVFATAGAILYSIVPPTLWVEGIATAEGYILPEILAAIILVALATITDGAGATALTAQIARFVAKIEEVFEGLGELGSVLQKLLDGLKAISDTITQLVRAARANIEEKVESASNTMNPILRHVSRRAGRRDTARKFMEKQGMSKDDIDGHASGIDFSQPAKVRPLEETEQFEQWNYRKPDGSFAQGDYYTTPGTDKDSLGISHERRNLYTGEMEQREKRVFQATRPESVLDSTARNKLWKNDGKWIKAKGGGRQIFSKSKDAFKEVDP